MKTLKWIILAMIMVSGAGSSFAHASDGQEGKGGDRAQPLFISAQNNARSIMERLKLNSLDKFGLSSSVVVWLKTGDNLSRLKFYVETMKPAFQDEACNQSDKPRSASFFTGADGLPYMCISYSLNRLTSSAEASALVIHEAAHFLGEMDHLFLSAMGVELVNKVTIKPVDPKKCQVVINQVYDRGLDNGRWFAVRNEEFRYFYAKLVSKLKENGYSIVKNIVDLKKKSSLSVDDNTRDYVAYDPWPSCHSRIDFSTRISANISRADGTILSLVGEERALSNFDNCERWHVDNIFSQAAKLRLEAFESLLSQINTCGI